MLRFASIGIFLLCSLFLFQDNASAKGGLSFEQSQKLINLFKPKALEGNAEAQFIYAAVLFDTAKYHADYKESAKWFKRAANQNHVHSLQMLYNMYYHGLGIQVDKDRAMEYLERAAYLGDNVSKFVLKNPGQRIEIKIGSKKPEVRQSKAIE